MFKNNRLKLTFISLALAFTSTALVAQSEVEAAEEETIEQTLVEVKPMTSSAFDYVTINQLLALDQAAAIKIERENAIKIGLIAEPKPVVAAPVLDNTIADIEAVADEPKDEPTPTVAPSLKSIYGLNDKLTVVVYYGGHKYQYRSGSRHNQTPNSGNKLSLRKINGTCVTLQDETINQGFRVCLKEGSHV